MVNPAPAVRDSPRPDRRSLPLTRAELAVVVVCACIWSVSTVFLQVRSIVRNSPNLAETVREPERILAGEAGAPERYHVLTPLMYQGGLAGLRGVGLSPRTVDKAPMLFRAAQDILALCLAAVYYRRLGFHQRSALVGMSLLAWAATQSQWGSTLGFALHTELVLYLAAATLIAGNRPHLAFLLGVVAAFNRGTAVMIPLLIVAGGLGRAPQLRRTHVGWGAAGLVAYVLVQGGLRVALGWAPPSAGSSVPGLLLQNARDPFTWAQVVGMWSVVPLLALAAWGQWPAMLRGMCVALVPLWCVAYLCASPRPDYAQLLVPLAVVFIPGALFAVGATPAGADSGYGP